jgi:UDP-N-acetyl-D-glucosamine dehydrogenase
MVKLLENTFRTVNISLINEFAMMCGKMGIDVWEVIDAAATKPFGFMPFYPGPGLGGHCLPVDPLYLSWKARLMDIEAGFIDLSTRINSYMPQYVTSKVVDALNSEQKCVNGSRILVLGVSYKKNVSDTRESPAGEIMHLLAEKGADISYCDPLVPEFNCGETVLHSRPLTAEVLRSNDCAVIVADHDAIDTELVLRHSHIVVDTRNATKDLEGKAKVVKI